MTTPQYVTFSWRGSIDPCDESGIATFTVLTRESIEIPFPSFVHAHKLYLYMLAIADMAHSDGRKSIKQQVARL